MRYVLVVSYPDGNGIKGAYGPYQNEAAARKAQTTLQELPGMGFDHWQAFPVHELYTRGGTPGSTGQPVVADLTGGKS